jgi:hypothetical protein
LLSDGVPCRNGFAPHRRAFGGPAGSVGWLVRRCCRHLHSPRRKHSKKRKQSQVRRRLWHRPRRLRQ